MSELRDYQCHAIDELRVAIKETKKPVLSSPTGSGKTRIASEIFAMARQRGKRVAFVVPFLSLIGQTWKAFVAAGIDEDEMGVIQADHVLTNWIKPVQICSIDTLARRKKLPEVDIVIFDECHKRSKVHKRWMDEAPNTRFIGLSATPWAKGMGEIWDQMIIVSTPSKLIKEGYLSTFRFFAPASPDLSGVKIRMGDYAEDQLSKAMNKQELVADIVTTWMKRGENRPTFCFAVDCAHAMEIQRQFNNAGIPAGYIDAYTEVANREAMIEQLRNGEIKVICNVGTMTTGVDAPFVSCIILARPTKSEMLYIQIIGRGLRLSEGKTDCLILDHSDTGLRLGLPDEIEYDDFVDAPLEIEKKAKKDREEPLPKKCPVCQFLKRPKERVCPACGFEPVKRSEVEVLEGELVEFRKASKPAKPTYDEKQVFWSGALFYAKERGYKQGWAAHLYKQRFGVWPQGLAERPEYPTQGVLNYIRSRNIAWAKSKNRNTSPLSDNRR